MCIVVTRPAGRNGEHIRVGTTQAEDKGNDRDKQGDKRPQKTFLCPFSVPSSFPPGNTKFQKLFVLPLLGLSVGAGVGVGVSPGSGVGLG